MDLIGFKQLFMDSKQPMPLDQAAAYIRKLRNDYPLMGKSWTFNRLEYNHRLAVATACDELEETFRKAAPWEDYREIIAGYIWPCMQRVLKHLNDGRYDGPYGVKWGVADAWFVEMWLAYDLLFREMPGTIPDIAPWRMLDTLLTQTERNTRNYRRNL